MTTKRERGKPMPSQLKNWLDRDQRGITGLETAIILIAFVVVASVFAYTVLSAGVFSSEKGKEAIHAGQEQARGSMEVVGSVKTTAVAATTLSNADDAAQWTPQANVTVATDSNDRKEGTASTDLVIAAGFTTGTVASDDITSVDISTHYSARLWIKSTGAHAANVFQLIIDDTAGCTSPLESMNLPALTAGTWTQALVKLADASLLTGVQCVGIAAASDPGTVTLTVDLVEAPAEVTQVHFIVANALDGEPIDLTTTTDSDSDGDLSDETKVHVVSVVYTDSEQRLTDVAWTKTELGQGDGDDLLEPGEKMQITVNTNLASPMPVDSSTFSITMVRNSGAVLGFERTLPRVLTVAMDLN